MLIVTMVNYDGHEEITSIRKKPNDAITSDLTNTSGWMMQFARTYLEYVQYLGELSIKVLYVFEDGSNKVFKREYFGYTYDKTMKWGNHYHLEYLDIKRRNKYIEIDSDDAKIISKDIHAIVNNPHLGEDISYELFKGTKYNTVINLLRFTNPKRWPTVLLVIKN